MIKETFIKYADLKNCTVILLCIFGLTACSSSPKTFIVMPDEVSLTSDVNSVLKNKSIALNVNDLRSNKHIVQIIKKNKAIEFINSDSQLSLLIQSTLTDEYQKKSAHITQNATNQLTVNISSAVVNVNQSPLKYEAKTTTVFNVTLYNGEKTLTKKYSHSTKSNGPLTAELAVLSRDFNQQLGKIINNLVNDHEVITLLK